MGISLGKQLFVYGITALALVTALSLSPAFSADPKLPKAGSMKDPTDPDLIALTKAQRLQSKVIGEAAEPSKNWQAYNTLRSKAASLSWGDIKWLQSNGTTASRVYGAFLFNRKDPAMGSHTFLEFLDDDSPIEYQSGCKVIKTSVSEIGSTVITTGKWMDFDNDAPLKGKPIYVKQLSTAPQFADQIGSESGRRLEWLVFLAASKHLSELKKEDLEQIKISGTPAGKLYAAVLLELSGTPKDQAYGKLLTDSSKVEYASGCKVMNYKVAEVAQKLKSTGKFHNFCVR